MGGWLALAMVVRGRDVVVVLGGRWWGGLRGWKMGGRLLGRLFFLTRLAVQRRGKFRITIG